MSHPISPLQPQERFELLDALRGFAIFGIFIVNMPAGALYWFAPAEQLLFPTPIADNITQRLMDSLIEGKFYSIFSLLFGLGFGLQLQRAQSRGVNGLPIFKRRLWGLLFIGLMHMLLLWLGDILFLYAWLGFVLILFRNKSDRYLLWGVLICLLIPLLHYPLRFLHPYASLGTPFFTLAYGAGKLFGTDIMEVNPVQLMVQPGLKDYFVNNLLAFFFRQGDLFDQVRPTKVMAVFFLGLLASRHRIHENPMAFFNRYKKWFWPVFLLALLINAGMGNITYEFAEKSHFIGWLKVLFYALGVVPLSLCYVYLFTRAYSSGKWRFLHAFTWVGRMALTNYLFQSVVYVILFRGPFLALAGKIGPFAGLVPVIVIFPLQVVFSKWWLQRFQYGPMEWVWRSMTYGTRQRFRRGKPDTYAKT